MFRPMFRKEPVSEEIPGGIGFSERAFPVEDGQPASSPETGYGKSPDI